MAYDGNLRQFQNKVEAVVKNRLEKYWEMKKSRIVKEYLEHNVKFRNGLWRVKRSAVDWDKSEFGGEQKRLDSLVKPTVETLSEEVDFRHQQLFKNNGSLGTDQTHTKTSKTGIALLLS